MLLIWSVEELNIDHSDVFVLGLFCICIIILILYFFNFVALWWPAAINPMFAESNKVFAIRYLLFAQPLCLFLHWNIEH